MGAPDGTLARLWLRPTVCAMGHSIVDDGALIRGTLAGRRQDFEVLVERYQKMLYAFVCRYLQDPSSADDVVQASFVKAYTHLAGFRGASSFKTWLHQIALNECRSQSRGGSARREIPLGQIPEEASAQECVDPGDAVWRTRLERLVGLLPQRQRAVLTLRVFSDLPFNEIARMERISENAAKVNYHHAIKRLRQWLS
jgi:RNA polymerase sigma-70 factor, ECF subfamily